MYFISEDVCTAVEEAIIEFTRKLIIKLVTTLQENLIVRGYHRRQFMTYIYGKILRKEMRDVTAVRQVLGLDGIWREVSRLH